jgi:formate hydrogenlyase transcriptional activator
VRRCARQLDKSIRSIDPDSLEQLVAYSWPGNVRELQNVIERSVIVCETETFTVDPGWIASGPAPQVDAKPRPLTEPAAPGGTTLDQIQREAIVRALKQCGWILGGPKGAAALLGLKRTTLQARMQKLGIAPRFRHVPGSGHACYEHSRFAPC